MHPLVTADELLEVHGSVRICDLRWDLTDRSKGRAGYEAGHIPSAVFVDLDVDLAASPGLDGRHPLPAPEDFAAALGRLAITPETHVVVYDDVGGRVAARMWWMLSSIGHEHVQLLDGGYQAWVAADGPVEQGSVWVQPVDYPVPEGFTGVVTHHELAGHVVLDARSPERYRGEVEPVDPKPGHIPGAVNIPTTSNVDDQDRFLDSATLADVYASVPDGAVVSCGSGVNACHLAAAMVMAGRPMPDVYVGSYSEWSRRDFPINTGDQP